MTHKALTSGFYWPTMVADAQRYMKKCDKWQRFAPIINLPANDMQPILCPLPFAQWGMKILKPFTTTNGAKKFPDYRH